MKLKRFWTAFIFLFLLVIFSVLAVAALLTTSQFVESAYREEKMAYPLDALWLNALVVLVCLGGLALLARKVRWRPPVWLVYALPVAYALAVGLTWVLSVRSLPGADALSVMSAAERAAQGNFTDFYMGADLHHGLPYLQMYPYQQSMVFLFEMLYRMTGLSGPLPLQILNVFAVSGIYVAILLITWQLFPQRGVQALAAILLMAFFPLLLHTTFVYGILLGLCAGLWAVSLLLAYLKNPRPALLAGMAVLLAVSILFKYNNLILLVAVTLTLLLFVIAHRKWQPLLGIGLCLALVFGSQAGIQARYARLTGEPRQDSVPQLTQLAMGLEKNSADMPGWYSISIFREYVQMRGEPEAYRRQLSEQVRQRLVELAAHPRYALVDIFYIKAVSQWNEPTYQGLWVSRVRDHAQEPPSWVASAYDGALNGRLEGWMNQTQQLIFLGFALSMWFCRKKDLPWTVLPLVILGGFWYHQLFEAKSQYVLPYVVMMIPYSAYGLCRVGAWIGKAFCRRSAASRGAT